MDALSRGLSRETIVASALHLARERDLRDVTLKAIAGDLDVTPMALYRYFPTKAALMSGVLDALVRDEDVTGHGVDPGDPRAWLRATFAATHRVLVERPGALALLTDGRHTGDAALTVVDEVLGVLRSADLDAPDAVRSFSALLAYTLGSAALEIATRASAEGLEANPDERARQLATGLSGRSRDEYPHVMECAPHLARSAVRYPFEAGLEHLLAGLDT